eukprot:CAMPEP_0118919816 /NCGR_PEP_ID=MMETSP1166-20130328/18753_1 /TAXON_ID=1104430 /ORGANISM="Chrysoreinhardia sp, Strain CCMP3193" /LENGTH=81 /DNA_ID=CAMNT_0006860351 /DNA_START=278 /DNA_END=523 /DNA_ORIENTATION=-
MRLALDLFGHLLVIPLKHAEPVADAELDLLLELGTAFLLTIHRGVLAADDALYALGVEATQYFELALGRGTPSAVNSRNLF